MSDTTRTRRPSARTATGLALAATMLTAAGVAAQSPSATTVPEATTAPTQTQSGSTDRPSRGDHRGMGGFDQGGSSRGGQPGFGGQAGFGSGSRGSQGPSSLRGSSVTVTAIDGANLGLETADGWTRTIDTTNVVITRDDTAIAITDLLVGERVSVEQTRNADGSYTVTGIEVRSSVVSGTVGTVSADGFTVVGGDGTTTNVTVDASTSWSASGSSTVTIADATAGRSVAVEGQLQADGSILATRVRLG